MAERKDKRKKNIKRDGPRLYLRPTASQERQGKTQIRIWAEEDTPEFFTELEAARLVMGASAPRLAGHDLDWLIMSYMRSPEYRRLGDSTKKVRANLLDDCAIRLGRKRSFNSIKTAEVRGIRDSMADRPEAANARIKALRQTYKWAVDCDLSEINPAMNVPYLPSNNPHGFHTWTEGEIEKYESVHAVGTKARLAIDLFQFTGVRRSDAVLLGPPMERQGVLLFTEQKNRENAPKDRCHADRTVHLSGHAIQPAVHPCRLWQLVQEALPRSQLGALQRPRHSESRRRQGGNGWSQFQSTDGDIRMGLD